MKTNPFKLTKKTGMGSYADFYFDDARRPRHYIIVTRWRKMPEKWTMYAMRRDMDIEDKGIRISAEQRDVLIAMCALHGDMRT